MALIWIASLMISDVGHPVTCLWAIWISYLEKRVVFKSGSLWEFYFKKLFIFNYLFFN